MSLGGLDADNLLLLGSPSSLVPPPSASEADLTLFIESPDFDPHTSPRRLRSELLRAARELSSRGLYAASKWAVEQVMGMPEEDGGHDGEECEPSGIIDEEEAAKEKKEEARLLLAKNHFDLKDYGKAARMLEPRSYLDDTDASELSLRALFFSCYSLYLAGEKRKEEETVELAGAEGSTVRNAKLGLLRRRLASRCAMGPLDGFCSYIYAIVLREEGQLDKARDMLAESVRAYPWNWSAWLDLAALPSLSWEHIASLNLPHHIMRDFFYAQACLEFQQVGVCLRIYDVLASVFPHSDFLLAQRAIANYHLREFDEAEALFEQLEKKDEFSVENMEYYSNILYVKENHAKLSILAHKAHTTDKYREETCCIIGNYYGLKEEHEKAVQYFSRAVRLNPKFLSAYILMGHEYMEMKNIPAAVRAYRKAAEINSRDYRAWYGLGQTYELLKMPHYATYYYQKGITLRPYDARIWCAMAACYEEVGRVGDAIKCYERAESYSEGEPIAMNVLNALANLYRSLGHHDQAAHYYAKNIQRQDSEQREGLDTIEALLYLAHYWKELGQMAEAEHYCLRLLDFAGKEKEEAKALLREIHSTQQAYTADTSQSPDPEAQIKSNQQKS